MGSGASSSGHNVGNGTVVARDAVDAVGAHDAAALGDEVELCVLADVHHELSEDEIFLLMFPSDDDEVLPVHGFDDDEQPAVLSTF
jgi:hypothetical protein